MADDDESVDKTPADAGTGGTVSRAKSEKNPRKDRKTSFGRSSQAINAPRKWVDKFLATLSECANITDACAAVGIERHTAYKLRKRDKDFAERWQHALEVAAERLEKEAMRRAVTGFQRPVFGSMGAGQGTGVVGEITEYSDTLLCLLLKGHMPDRYRERQQIEHSGAAPTINIQINVLPDDGENVVDVDADVEGE